MKKKHKIINLKKIFLILSFILIVFSQNFTTSAKKHKILVESLIPKKQIKQKSTEFPIQKPKIITTTSPLKKIHLKNGITKNEEIQYINYEYTGDLANNPNKYFTIRIEISYFFQNEPLAICYAENNFRYNSIAKEAKCLSSSTYRICTNPKSNLEISARHENETWTLGRGYASIKFTFNNTKLDSSDYSFTCDCTGEISEIFDEK